MATARQQNALRTRSKRIEVAAKIMTGIAFALCGVPGVHRQYATG